MCTVDPKWQISHSISLPHFIPKHSFNWCTVISLLAIAPSPHLAPVLGYYFPPPFRWQPSSSSSRMCPLAMATPTPSWPLAQTELFWAQPGQTTAPSFTAFPLGARSAHCVFTSPLSPHWPVSSRRTWQCLPIHHTFLC